MSDEVLEAWHRLPRRIYLDTSTLQTIADFPDPIFEDTPFEPSGRALRTNGLAEEVTALRCILLVNDRAHFEFVVTDASFSEVVARQRPAYTDWVREVARAWEAQVGEESAPTSGAEFQDRRFGMVSVNDRKLLQDAFDWRCDAFITMERNLPTAAEFIERETGLRVMRPTAYWHLLAPWASLYL